MDAPKVVGLKAGEARVELSGRFLELLSGDPEAAAAVLEHELAHVTHKDISPRPFTQTFWHVLNRTSIATIVPVILGVSFSIWVNTTSSGRQFLFQHFPVHSVTERASTEVVTTYRGNAGNGQIVDPTPQRRSSQSTPTNPKEGSGSAVTRYSQAGNGQTVAADPPAARDEVVTTHSQASSFQAATRYSEAGDEQMSHDPHQSQSVTTRAKGKSKKRVTSHNVHEQDFFRFIPANLRLGIFLATFAIVPTVIWLLLVLNFRRERWLSERMADLEVILQARGQALVRALDFFAPKRDWAGLFSLHPSVTNRKKYILTRT
ncbi:MAG: hypothetical protein WAL41_03800 [Mycobacterium sp.]